MEHYSSFQEARESVARFELLSLVAETEIQQEAVLKELQRAKVALHSAFTQSTPAEQDQLVQMQEHLQRMYQEEI